MPLFDYKCPQCEHVEELFLHNTDKPQICKECGTEMKRVFSKVHTSIDGTWDGKPVGKVIQEKNEALKKKHAGYSYEQHNLREKITKHVNEKLSGSGQ